MEDNQSPKLKVTSRERIFRILERICSASLPVLLRKPDGGPVAVRGRASNITSYLGQDCIRVSNISLKGAEYISRADFLQIEFVGRSTQLTFKAKVIKVQGNSVVFDLPKVIESVERRQNARYAVSQNMSSFVSLGLWSASPHQITSPPVFDVHPELSSLIMLADISEGGFCAVSRFPGMLNVLGKGVMDDGAQLFLPMQKPIAIGVEVRWVKRIKENVAMEHEGRFTRHFRFGVNFIGLSEDSKLVIQQYIKQLSMADAI